MGGNAQETPAYTSSSQYFENRGPNHTNRVILSFDDCPRSYAAFKSTVDASTTEPGDTILADMSWNAFNPSTLSQIKAGLGKRGIGLCQAYVGKTTPTKLPNNLPC